MYGVKRTSETVLRRLLNWSNKKAEHYDHNFSRRGTVIK